MISPTTLINEPVRNLRNREASLHPHDLLVVRCRMLVLLKLGDEDLPHFGGKVGATAAGRYQARDALDFAVDGAFEMELAVSRRSGFIDVLKVKVDNGGFDEWDEIRVDFLCDGGLVYFGVE